MVVPMVRTASFLHCFFSANTEIKHDALILAYYQPQYIVTLMAQSINAMPHLNVRNASPPYICEICKPILYETITTSVNENTSSTIGITCRL